jgi:outer membrane protein TolC
MSKFAACLLALLLTSPAIQASDPVSKYVDWRYHTQHVEVRDVEGLQDRIVAGKLHLRLHDFLVLVLKNATDIRLTRLDLYTAADQVTAAKAPFDPTLVLGYNTLRTVTPLFFDVGGLGTSTSGQSTGTGSNLPGLTQIGLPATISSLSSNSLASYTQLLPTGQTIAANFNVNRTSGEGFPFPTLFGSLNVSITQPLLQNRTNIQARGPLIIARTQFRITTDRSEAAIGNAVAMAARQYWSAIQTRDNIAVEQQNFDLARKSYEHDKQALELGALAKLDIYQSETQVAERKRDLVAARFAYKAALDALRRLIGADLTPTLRDTEIVLEDDASDIPARSSVLPFEQALGKAMQVRPELRAAERATSIDDLNARIAHDALTPKLDLTAQGGANGPNFNPVTAGGSTTTVTSPFPGLGATLGQVLGFDFPSYGFGLQLTFPFRNSTAQANLSDALVNRTRDLYTKRQVEQQIISDVRQAIDAIDLAHASIEAAISARDLARQNVAAEQQKYELGTITAFELLDSQTRLASSESALLNAYVTYQQAYIDYQRATWTMLDGLGMVIESPKPL